MQRLFVVDEDISILNENINNLDADDVDCTMIMVENETKTLKQKLEMSINSSLATYVIKKDVNTVLKEINLYEVTGQITPNLKLIKNALLTIRPTSTENERNFSTAGHIVSKKRTRLSDKAINALCFLKYHFLKNKN